MLRRGKAGITWILKGVHGTIPGWPLKRTAVSMESIRLSQSIPGNLSEYSGDFDKESPENLQPGLWQKTQKCTLWAISLKAALLSSPLIYYTFFTQIFM